MNDARDTQIDYVHRSCMWAGNDEAGDMEQPRTFGADDEWRPLTTAEAVKFWGTVLAAVAFAIGCSALIAAMWPAA